MKWKIFTYLAGFVAIMLILLWLFQVVFLEQFYRHVKSQQIEETAQDIAKNIDKEDLVSYIDSMSENSDYCIRVIDIDQSSSYSNEVNKGVCGALVTSTQELNELYAEAKNNDGETLVVSDKENYKSFDDFNRYELDSSLQDQFENDFQVIPFPKKMKDPYQTMTYAIIPETDTGHYFVLVNSRITLVDEIASTIRLQLVIFTGILIVLALIVALLISSRISKPISKINKAAKKLSNGDFEVSFEGKGYLEIEELKETLTYASKELSKVEKLRNELIANMSHDLRTPLTMIAGYGEVMRDLPNENTAENVQIIIDECHRLTALVNDILDLSKLQSGAQELNVSPFNLTKEVQGVVNRFDKMLKKDKYHITFSYENDVIVNADIIKISQVLYNLLVNATHYTGEDKVVEVKQTIVDNRVRIEVIDHGEGIAQKDLMYVWDRYYKIDKVHKRNQVGSGLGLSIVRGILELHKAEYGVHSKEKEGSTFYFDLLIHYKE